jgi:hypothetical protein
MYYIKPIDRQYIYVVISGEFIEVRVGGVRKTALPTYDSRSDDFYTKP